MARPPRGGSWKEEYRRRVERAQAQGLPKAVARGHGPIPIKVVRKVERQIAGHPRALPVKTQVKYRRGIGQYEKQYHGGRLVTGHRLVPPFPSKEVAEQFLETTMVITPQSEYVTIQEAEGEWRIVLLR